MKQGRSIRPMRIGGGPQWRPMNVLFSWLLYIFLLLTDPSTSLRSARDDTKQDTPNDIGQDAQYDTGRTLLCHGADEAENRRQRALLPPSGGVFLCERRRFSADA